MVSFDRVRTVFESLGEMGYAFQGLKSLWKLSGVCEFCGLQSAGRKPSACWSEIAYSKTKTQYFCFFIFLFLFTVQNHKVKELASYQFWPSYQNSLPVRVHQPLSTVRDVPLYQMCWRVAYFHVAFLCQVLWKVCEFWKDFCVWILS